MQADTVGNLRAAGIPMGGRQAGTQYGWTTDSAVAELAESLGARAVPVKTYSGSGWELSVPPGPPEEDDDAA